MLYKPTSAFPHRDIIDITNDINFNCQTLSNSTIDNIRIMINDNKYEHYFVIESGSFTSDYSNYGLNLYWTCQTNENGYQDKESYQIALKNSSRTSASPSSTDSSKLLTLKSNSSYTWQMRIYENSDSDSYSPTSWIGWGVVDSVSTVYRQTQSSGGYAYHSSQGTNSTYEEMCLLKIRPHTNMYFAGATGGSQYKNLFTRYDDNAKYYIKIGGKIYLISDYKFYNPTGSFDADNDLDSYGDPLYGYAIINAESEDDTIIEGEEYTIFCNYIDSDAYYFETKSTPTIELYECFKSQTSSTDDIKRAISSENSLDNPLNISYSNFNLEGEFTQSEGAVVNYYSFLLEELNDSTYVTIDSTGNIFSPVIKYSYDRFLSNTQYRLTLSITDTTGVTTNKVVYITTEYDGDYCPLTIKVEPYREHNSLIIDFNDLVSITAKEKVSGGHQFLPVDTATGELVIDESIGEVSETAEKNVCHVDKGNTLTYDYIDGEKSLSFGENTYYALIKVDPDYTGELFRVTDDNGDFVYVTWTGERFEARWRGLLFNTGGEYYVDNVRWTSLTESQKIEKINEVLGQQASQDEVPYLYYDALTYGEDDVYYHEETQASKYTWLIIVNTWIPTMRCFIVDPNTEDKT